MRINLTMEIGREEADSRRRSRPDSNNILYNHRGKIGAAIGLVTGVAFSATNLVDCSSQDSTEKSSGNAVVDNSSRGTTNIPEPTFKIATFTPQITSHSCVDNPTTSAASSDHQNLATVSSPYKIAPREVESCIEPGKLRACSENYITFQDLGVSECLATGIWSECDIRSTVYNKVELQPDSRLIDFPDPSAPEGKIALSFSTLDGSHLDLYVPYSRRQYSYF